MSINIGALGASPSASTDDSSASGSKTLGQDDFLKLLVAQLQNQNPMEQTDNTQFIAEMAQFSTVEQLQNVNAGIEQLSALVSAVSLGGLLGEGSNLINKQVTGVDPSTGSSVTGVVSGVRVDSGQIILEPLGIPLENVSQVSEGDVQK